MNPVQKSIVAICVFCASAVPLAANVTSVGLSGGVLGDRVSLTQIGVQRGAETHVYTYDDLLIPALDAISLQIGSSRVVMLYADPLDGFFDLALSDRYVNTGLFDIGQGVGAFATGAEYIQLGFGTPVINDEGPDLVLAYISFVFIPSQRFFLSVDGSTAWPVDKAPEFMGGQIDNIPYYSFTEDIDEPLDLLNNVSNHVGNLGNPPSAIPMPMFMSLDLSDFGVAPGGSISTLYLQDKASDNRDIRLTFVAGLPSTTMQDSDGDGVGDLTDVCPQNAPNLDVDCDGRPKLDMNNDCQVDGSDLQAIVNQLLGQ